MFDAEACCPERSRLNMSHCVSPGVELRGGSERCQPGSFRIQPTDDHGYILLWWVLHWPRAVLEPPRCVLSTLANLAQPLVIADFPRRVATHQWIVMLLLVDRSTSDRRVPATTPGWSPGWSRKRHVQLSQGTTAPHSGSRVTCGNVSRRRWTVGGITRQTGLLIRGFRAVDSAGPQPDAHPVPTLP